VTGTLKLKVVLSQSLIPTIPPVNLSIIMDARKGPKAPIIRVIFKRSFGSKIYPRIPTGQLIMKVRIT